MIAAKTWIAEQIRVLRNPESVLGRKLVPTMGAMHSIA